MVQLSQPRYTPYDGSDPLFKIGLQPLDLKDWLEVDHLLGFYLDEKERLAACHGGKVFAEETDTRTAQQEVLDLILAHLAEHHQATHEVMDDSVKVAGREVKPGGDEPPLRTAARLVQEDLIIMRKGESGWRLAAASLSFPSSWRLLEKFSRPLHEIHAPVPGFGAGTRNAALIERIFDNLTVAIPARRFNWSVYRDDELYHADKSAEDLKAASLSEGAYLRVEHQTLRRLPQSGDILFTVRIHLDPLETLKTHPRNREICDGFIRSLRALDESQLTYKGLIGERDGLIRKLGEISGKEVA